MISERSNYSLSAVGAGGLAAVAVLIGLGSLGVFAVTWGNLAGPGRVAVSVGVLACLTFAGALGFYSFHSLLSVRDTYRYNRDARQNAILGGNIKPGWELPRSPIPVRGNGIKVLQDDAPLSGTSPAFRDVLLSILDRAQVHGLGRRAHIGYMPASDTAGKRQIYDRAMSTLVELGCIEGRSNRQSGRLAHDAAVCQSIVNRAYMSIPGGKLLQFPGQVPTPSHNPAGRPARGKRVTIHGLGVGR